MKLSSLFFTTFTLFFLLGCESNNSNENSKTTTKTVIEPITSETELIFNPTIENSEGSFFVWGKTNLPEGTKIAMELQKNGEVFAQNFEIFVKDGDFGGAFGVNLNKVENVVIEIHANEFWQNETILKQLDLLKTDNWKGSGTDKAIVINIDVSTQRKEQVNKIINPQINYKPISKIDGKIRNIPLGSVKRINFNLNFKNEVSNEIANKEIRYWLFEIWSKNQDAKAIRVSCFIKNNQLSFKNGVFAPLGDWNNENANIDFSKYKVIIN